MTICPICGDAVEWLGAGGPPWQFHCRQCGIWLSAKRYGEDLLIEPADPAARDRMLRAAAESEQLRATIRRIRDAETPAAVRAILRERARWCIDELRPVLCNVEALEADIEVKT